MTTPPEFDFWNKQAVLYAAGVLSPEESVDFERHLAESQEVRDSLVRAMEQLAQRWGVPGPAASWRRNLQRRLQAHKSTTFGWPSLALAAFLGAIGATMVTGLILRWPTSAPPQLFGVQTHSHAEQAAPASELAPTHGPDTLTSADDAVALAYVDLTNHEQRMAALHHWTTERRSAHKTQSLPISHAPLLEYFTQPCAQQKPAGM
ncbi:MAG: hypothetical protein RMI91_12950 [Gemmatales bacterium]|nr:hypothetical protein [Gemmatales bacterium]MDW7995551.1 hypothetical protein [Gemmatales bacterium]